MLGSPGRLARRLAAAFIVVVSFVTGPASADEEVDLELVLAVDVSGSMDRDEQALQRAGYVSAIRHPDVLDAIRTGLTGRIAVVYLEWAGPSAHRIVVPWQAIDGPETAEAFAERLAAAPVGTMRGTSISSGLTMASTLFEGNGFTGHRQVIDISGDGPNNMGPPVLEARDAVLALGIVVNGLPIMLKQGQPGYGSIRNLHTYYADCVIGGPGAFLVPVDHPSGLVEAIRRKMILEIADLAGGFEAFVARPAADHGTDCRIGERQREMWMDR